MWFYHSPLGVIRIVKGNDGLFFIVINDEYCGPYHSPVAAADDVFTFSTGCYDWDVHSSDPSYQLSVPTDIHQWHRAD